MVGPSSIASMAQAGVGSLRYQVNWRAVQRTRGGAYDWSQPDAVIAAAAANGMQVLGNVFGSPAYMTSSSAVPPIGSPADLADWSAFVGATVARYGPDGDFWAAHPELPAMPIRQWEVWNEESSPNFWGGATPSPSEYATLLAAADQAIDAVDPGARVLVGGLTGTDSADYLNRLYAVPGASDHFDGVSDHPYANTPELVMKRVAEIRDTMDANGDTRSGIWVTELGWGSSDTVGRLLTDITGQATYLHQAFKGMIRHRRAYGLRMVSWFTWQDDSVVPVCGWCGDAGLVGVDGNAKPALQSFSALADDAVPKA
jgi:hypothetical protein